MPREEKWLVYTECGSPSRKPSKMEPQDGGLHEKREVQWKKVHSECGGWRYCTGVDGTRGLPELTLASHFVFPDACHTLWMNLPLQNTNAMDSSVF